MYNVSTDKCNYFFNYNNDYQVNLLAEINLINKLHDDFELPWSKFFAATCNSQLFVIFVVLLVLKIEKKIGNLLIVMAKKILYFTYLLKNNVNICEELKVFDSLYEKCKLKSHGWTKFSAGYIPPEKFPVYITEEKDANFVFRIIKIEEIKKKRCQNIYF